MRDRKPPVGERCRSCGSHSLLRERVPIRGCIIPPPEPIDVFACEDCGDWWFEHHGESLTIEKLAALGLIS